MKKSILLLAFLALFIVGCSEQVPSSAQQSPAQSGSVAASANTPAAELSAIQQTCKNWEEKYNPEALKEGNDANTLSCEAQTDSCVCKFKAPTKTLLGVRITPLAGDKSTLAWICRDTNEVKTASDCDYLDTAKTTGSTSQTTTWTDEAPSSPTECKMCDVEPMTYDNYDHIYRPGWNQTCHDKIMDCLTSIYKERQKDSIVDPMCDSKGHNCLCFDGYPKSKDRETGPYRCYIGLAQRLCDDKVTQEFCNGYSTYFPTDVTQVCIQQVNDYCMKNRAYCRAVV